MPPTPLGWVMVMLLLMFSPPVALVMASIQLYSSAGAFRVLSSNNPLTP